MMKRSARLAGLVLTISLLALGGGVAVAAAAQHGGIAPGLYEGQGKLAGGFSSKGTNVQIKNGGEFEFCMRVMDNGDINSTASAWVLQPTTITVDESDGSTGRLDMDGTGPLSGYAFRPGIAIWVKGTDHFSMTIDVNGFTFQDKFDMPVDGTLAHELPWDRVAHTHFSGDIAWPNRETQQGLGFNSTETGKYTAHRVTSCSLATPPTLG
jgi:hypothetical protein